MMNENDPDMYSSKTELNRFLSELDGSPGAGSTEEAWQLICASLIAAAPRTRDGTLWTIPQLHASSVNPYGSGKAIRLIGHHIYINASGAFCIVELGQFAVKIFELSSKSGIPFDEIVGYHMPLA